MPIRRKGNNKDTERSESSSDTEQKTSFEGVMDKKKRLSDIGLDSRKIPASLAKLLDSGQENMRMDKRNDKSNLDKLDVTNDKMEKEKEVIFAYFYIENSNFV